MKYIHRRDQGALITEGINWMWMGWRAGFTLVIRWKHHKIRVRLRFAPFMLQRSWETHVDWRPRYL